MAGFLLLPLRQSIAEGKLHEWPDHALATLVVLMAHESAKTRIACPSQDRVAILAGINKQAVAEAIAGLGTWGWLRKSRLPAPGGRTRFQYHMAYDRYQRGDTSGKWLRLESYVVLNGLWAAMPPSTRRLYLALLAFSWSGSTAGFTEDNISDWMLEPRDSIAGRFVDARYLDPAELRRLLSLEPRTFTRAWAWLKDEMLLESTLDESIETDTGYFREGVFLSHLPDLHAPAVMNRLEKLKGNALHASTGAKRLLRHTRRTAGSDQTRKKTRRALPQTPLLKVPDTTEPEQVFEPTSNKPLTRPLIARPRCLALVRNNTPEDTPSVEAVSYGDGRRARG